MLAKHQHVIAIPRNGRIWGMGEVFLSLFFFFFVVYLFIYLFCKEKNVQAPFHPSFLTYVEAV